MNSAIINDAVKELTDQTKKIYGNKLRDVILFGSCARGDYQDGSDVDVMILLDIPKEMTPEVRRNISDITGNITEQYDYELLFSVIIQNYEEFNYWADVLPFYQNVIKEGIRYA